MTVLIRSHIISVRAEEHDFFDAILHSSPVVLKSSSKKVSVRNKFEGRQSTSKHNGNHKAKLCFYWAQMTMIASTRYFVEIIFEDSLVSDQSEALLLVAD